MRRSVPGLDLDRPEGAAARALFDAATVARYQARAVRGRRAVPHRREAPAEPRSEYPSYGLDAASGLVYDRRRSREVRDRSSTTRPCRCRSASARSTRCGATQIFTHQRRRTIAMPTGLGWFVTTESGQRLVWTFGHIQDASSALIVKIVTPATSSRAIEAPDADHARQQRRPGEGLRSRERQRHVLAVRESIPAPVHLTGRRPA